MAKTATDLAKQIGRELLLIDGVSELAGEDDATIKEMSEAYHETLDAYGIRVNWDPDAIPNKVFLPLARTLAGVMAGTFGDALPENELLARMATLNRAAALPYTGSVNQTEYL